jgi:hypothetical protein
VTIFIMCKYYQKKLIFSTTTIKQAILWTLK